MQQNDSGWKIQQVDTICDFARIITPYEPKWSNGNPLWSIALRLTDGQVAKLRSLGAKCEPKIHKYKGHTIYNYIRHTLSKKGNPVPELEVVRWDKKIWTDLVGDGSEVRVILEYAPYASGVNAMGQSYSAGVTFRLGAVQILKWVAPVEYEKTESKPLTKHFKVMPRPEGYIEPNATLKDNFNAVDNATAPVDSRYEDTYEHAKQEGQSYDYVPEDIGQTQDNGII